jgi:hypothetical protein
VTVIRNQTFSRWFPAVICLALAATGCSLEAPEAPQFMTTLNLPLEEQTYTGEDMAQSLEAIIGSTVEPGPLTVWLEETVEPVYFDDQVTLTMVAASYELNPTEIDFDPPALQPVSLGGDDLLGSAFSPGVSLPVPAFTFEIENIDLGTFDDFAEVVFAGGSLQLTLTNRFPLSLGDAGGGVNELVITVLDQSQSPAATVAEFKVPSVLMSGESFMASIDLAGTTIGNQLSIHISGGSVGSGDGWVTLSETQDLAIGLVFQETEVRSLSGQLPALDFSTEVDFALGDEVVVEQAVVKSGRFSWEMINDLPMPITVILRTENVLFGGTSPMETTLNLSPGAPTVFEIDLSNAVLVPDENGQWLWHISATSQGSGGEAMISTDSSIHLAIAESELVFSSVRGIVEAVEVAFDAVDAEIEFPEGTEGIQFVAAEAELTINNRAGMAASAELALTGERDGETVTVAFSTQIPAGSQALPSVTTVLLDETNSNVIELLTLRPETVSISGVVRVGDGVTSGELNRGDFLDGAFTLQAPMKLLLENAQIDGDPFDIEMDDDIREQVSEHLETFTVEATVENHFPTAVNVKFHFARSEGALFINDDLVLEAETILPATVDPVTGRVTASVNSTITMTLLRGDLDVFLEEILYGAQEVTLIGDGENPVEIWSTDYVTVKGIASFEYLVN